MKATDIRRGHVILIDGQPCRVMEFTHRTPGNLRAFVQVRLRNLVTGNTFDTRLSATDFVDVAPLETKEFQVLYRDQSGVHVMDTNSYDQHTLDDQAVGDHADWLQPEMHIQVEWLNGRPVGIELPAVVELTVVQTSPVMRSATKTASTKPAKLSNGVTVQVLRAGDAGAMVNQAILANYPLVVRWLAREEAVASGAMALFGEKYGDLVRVVSVGEFSKELCGGTHTGRSGDIGIFKIISEGGVAAGIRRIEAVTGEAAYKHLLSLQDYIQEASSILKTRPDNLLDRISKMLQREKELEKTVSSLQGKLAGGEIEALLNSVKEIKGVKVLSARVDVSDPKGMKDMADMLKERLISGIIVLGSSDGSKSTLTAAVSGDLTKNYHAGNIVKELAKIVGGGGGGRPDMAQAGGPDISKLDEALNKVFEII